MPPIPKPPPGWTWSAPAPIDNTAPTESIWKWPMTGMSNPTPPTYREIWDKINRLRGTSGGTPGGSQGNLGTQAQYDAAKRILDALERRGAGPTPEIKVSLSRGNLVIMVGAIIVAVLSLPWTEVIGPDGKPTSRYDNIDQIVANLSAIGIPIHFLIDGLYWLLDQLSSLADKTADQLTEIEVIKDSLRGLRGEAPPGEKPYEDPYVE